MGKEKVKKIEDLIKAYEERDWQLVELKVNKDDTRFKELVRRVGIPDLASETTPHWEWLNL